MHDRYSRLKAERRDAIPWSEMIDLLEERLNQPRAYVEEVWFGKELTAEQKAERDGHPDTVAYERVARVAITRYRMSKNAPISQKTGNVIFGELEAHEIVTRDQEGNIFALRKDATLTRLT